MKFNNGHLLGGFLIIGSISARGLSGGVSEPQPCDTYCQAAFDKILSSLECHNIGYPETVKTQITSGIRYIFENFHADCAEDDGDESGGPGGYDLYVQAEITEKAWLRGEDKWAYFSAVHSEE